MNREVESVWEESEGNVRTFLCWLTVVMSGAESHWRLWKAV